MSWKNFYIEWSHEKTWQRRRRRRRRRKRRKKRRSNFLSFPTCFFEGKFF